MSKWQARHPDEGELLRYADGELPVRRARQVRKHLESCWECRAAFQEIQNTVGECIRYRRDLFQPYTPAPPEPWSDIYRGFADIDATPGNTTMRDVLAGVLQFPVRHARHWIPLAAAAAVLCAIYLQFRNAPPVQAAELLRKAVAAADTRIQPVRHLRIRTSRREFTRATYSTASGAGSPAARADTAPDSLEPLFRAAHFNWEDPLSARSFQNWHDQAPGAHDRVESLADGFRIHTTTERGEIAAATLKLHSLDLHPVEERIEFRNREWVEISEVSAEAAPLPVAAARGLEAPAPPAPAPAATPAPPVAGLGDELLVIAALHRVGADLGEPVEVTRAGGQVLVSGVGIAPDRRRQIQDAVGNMRHVVVRFSEPETPEAVAPTTHPETASSAQPSRISTTLERLAGGRAQFERLSAQLLDLNESMMARAYALHLLSRRFSPQVETTLSAEERRTLDRLAREHAAQFATYAAGMDRILGPWLNGRSTVLETPPAETGPWQPAAEDVFQKARRLDRLLATAMGGASGETAAADAPANLLAGLSQVRTAAARCGQMAASAGGPAQ